MINGEDTHYYSQAIHALTQYTKDRIFQLTNEQCAKSDYYLKKIQTIKTEYAVKMNSLNLKFLGISNSLRSLLKSNILPTTPNFLEIVNFKDASNTIFHEESFINKLKEMEGQSLALPQQPQVLHAAELQNGYCRILNADLAQQKFNLFSSSSRCLPIGNTGILITGGHICGTLFCILDLQTGTLTFPGSLNIPRKNHSVTYIDNKPAVIGGETINNPRSIPSVEILDQDWKEIESLNVDRAHAAAACNRKGGTYTFGGASNNIPLNSIEEYKQNRWILLGVKLPEPLCSLGTYATVSGSFILLGGYTVTTKYDATKVLAGAGISFVTGLVRAFTGNKEEGGWGDSIRNSGIPGIKVRANVYEWDEMGMRQLESLEKAALFYSNLWLRTGNCICAYDNDSEVIRYLLKS